MMTLSIMRRAGSLATALAAMLMAANMGFAQQQNETRAQERLSRHAEATDGESRAQPSDRQQQPRLQSEQQSRAWLGVVIQPADDGEGVRVADIYPSGPAARADFRQGDVILSIDGIRITDPQQVTRVLGQQQPDSKVAVTLQRGEEKVKTNVRLGDRDEFLGRSEPMDQFGQRQTQYRGEGGYPEHALMLEQHRHLATQHQRLEELLNMINDRLDKLQQDIDELKQQ